MEKTMHLKEGTLLQGGKYRIESILGQGGFGITYLAFQPGYNRKVAIKEFFIKEYCNRDEATSHVSVPSTGSKELVEKFKAKFVKEAQTIMELNHPHIVRVYSVFEENGTAYYVMEYHGAGSLSSQRLPVEPESVVFYAKQISSALAYLHKSKIMHLDVKPANVLIDEYGNAVLIDFGVSKHYDEAGLQTSSLPICFSRYYAPIEQDGQTPLKFSPSIDIYALGATMYKLLTGQTPPQANALLNNPSLLSFPVDAPPHLVSLIEKCMRPVIEDRPQSIEDFLKLLPEVEEVRNSRNGEVVEGGGGAEKEKDRDKTNLSGSGQTSGPDTGSDSGDFGGPAPRKRRLWLWVTLIAAVVVGAVTYFMWPTGYENGHEWVDLGLPSGLKWATCNVGASSPEDYGDYYAWGEVSTKDTYTKSNCSTHRKSIGDISGNPEYDVARAKWGGSWRMPTEAEFRELIDNCTWEWTTKGGHNGYKVTGPNGNSIFLPAAGYRDGAGTDHAESGGYYWSATPYESDTQNAYYLYFLSDRRYTDWYRRYLGQSVRPVSE